MFAPRMVVLALVALFALTAVNTLDIDRIFARTEHVDPEVVLDRTFTTRPGERLAVDVRHADVLVGVAGGNEAHVRITVDGRSLERARDFFEHLRFEVDQNGSLLSIRNRPRGNWNGSTGRADIRVSITIPEAFEADIDVVHGDVHVERLKGSLSLHVEHGDLRIGALGGSMLSIDVAHGDVEAERFMSDRIRMDVQHGDVAVREVVSAEFAVSMAHGDIDVQSLNGYPNMRSQHGDIFVRLVESRGGDFTAAHGDIELAASSETAVDVELRASEVDMASSYRFEGMQRDGTFEGRINGGGPLLSARTTHGDVRLRSTD